MKLALVTLAFLILLAACNRAARKDQSLEGLPAAELAALRAVCEAAGTEPTKLRNVGFVADFRHERNRLAVAIRDGHVHTLALNKSTFRQTPDFSKLSGMQALWLEDGALPSWPDLSKLTQLKALHLNGQALGTPPPEALPRQLETIELARTQVSELGFLAGFFSLRTLDVSGTKVDSIEPVMGLELDQLNLARTPIRALPARLPARGAWELDLDQTALTQIPGFSRSSPPYRYSSSTPTEGDSVTGSGKAGNIQAEGTIRRILNARPVHLPHDQILERDSGPVTLEATVASGKVRVWLREPAGGIFAEPWFGAGKVKGWGRFRTMGSVSVVVEPGKKSTLRGALWGQGNEPRYIYHFVVEPVVDGSVASGFEFHVRASQ